MLTRTSSDRRVSLRMLMAEMVYWFQYQCLSSRPFHSQDLISKSPYCLLYSSYDFSSKNLVLDQLVIPYLKFSSITCPLDFVLLL